MRSLTPRGKPAWQRVFSDFGHALSSKSRHTCADRRISFFKREMGVFTNPTARLNKQQA
jgi:hypothetical protein